MHESSLLRFVYDPLFKFESSLSKLPSNGHARRLYQKNAGHISNGYDRHIYYLVTIRALISAVTTTGTITAATSISGTPFAKTIPIITLRTFSTGIPLAAA